MDTKCRVNHMTLKCDLGIKFAQPGHMFCTLAYCEEHLDRSGLKASSQPSCLVPTYVVHFFKFSLGGDFP